MGRYKDYHREPKGGGRYSDQNSDDHYIRGSVKFFASERLGSASPCRCFAGRWQYQRKYWYR